MGGLHEFERKLIRQRCDEGILLNWGDLATTWSSSASDRMRKARAFGM
jgi:hypothetical protein